MPDSTTLRQDVADAQMDLLATLQDAVDQDRVTLDPQTLEAYLAWRRAVDREVLEAVLARRPAAPAWCADEACPLRGGHLAHQVTP